jgi:hypothetical protein
MTNIASLITRPCTLRGETTTGTRGAYGHETTAPTSVETVCEVQQRQRSEAADQGELSETDWHGFFLPTESMNGASSVEVPGLGTFEFVGDPWKVRDPETQAESHWEASLTRTAGPEDA